MIQERNQENFTTELESAQKSAERSFGITVPFWAASKKQPGNFISCLIIYIMDSIDNK